MNKTYLVGALSILLFMGAGCSGMKQTSSDNMMKDDSMAEEGVMVGGSLMVQSKNIVENASTANNVTTLVAAVQAAGLVDTLSSPGPFTVFGPTNDAFDKLPAGTVGTLLKPENKDMLTTVLTYHVVPGVYRSTDLKNGMQLTTVQGEKITITEKSGKWYVNGTAMIETADVISSNGVTHVIDGVLLPSDQAMAGGVMVGGALMVRSKNIVENAVNASNVTTLVSAVQAGGLVDTLSGPGPFTVFAPTNVAFESLPAGTVDTLLKPENKEQLVSVLTYHVVPGAYRASDLKNNMQLTTVQGEKITITEKSGKWYVNGTAMVETADVISSNGVTHVINNVLLPKN
jgi:transforming growth factor-beta-induced protein